MRKETYKIDNTKYIRIDKKLAEKMFNTGLSIDIAMVNANMEYLLVWNLYGITINKEMYSISVWCPLESINRLYILNCVKNHNPSVINRRDVNICILISGRALINAIAIAKNRSPNISKSADAMNTNILL